jgi:hypothetical protein
VGPIFITFGGGKIGGFGRTIELLIEKSWKNKTKTNFKYMLNICKFK